MSDARRIAAFRIPAVEADDADDALFVSVVWEHLNFVSTLAGFADDELPAMAPHARDHWCCRNDCHGPRGWPNSAIARCNAALRRRQKADTGTAWLTNLRDQLCG